MNKFLPLAAVLAALVAAPAVAEDWHELAVTGDAIGYGDADSLTNGAEVSARVMLGLRQAMGEDANIEFLVSSVRFSCDTGRYFVDAVSGLDGERATVAALPGSREWKPVAEGTLYASFRDFACGTATAAQPVADPYRASADFWHPDTELLEAGTIELAGQFYAG